IAIELAKVANVNIDKYGLELLKAGTKLSAKTTLELVQSDSKTFDINEKSVRIVQINAIGFDEMLGRKDELLEAMREEIAANNFDLFILFTTDILESDSIAFVLGENTISVEKAFKHPVVEEVVTLSGVVSRKKQIVPQLTEAFSD